MPAVRPIETAPRPSTATRQRSVRQPTASARTSRAVATTVVGNHPEISEMPTWRRYGPGSSLKGCEGQDDGQTSLPIT